ncbi:hypothetical protein CYMTET_22896 [Cymbomonas tetramitiformis]|uniref:Uncharacterized protein n=1 Tax=Cymbomonas tetramitiformis TaxID=36881 RepID=A0AAE0L1M9_9CHLO|nr:hypothetical protein CYMTET_22896 [Cymbomonas tetramitiformis]
MVSVCHGKVAQAAKPGFFSPTFRAVALRGRATAPVCPSSRSHRVLRICSGQDYYSTLGVTREAAKADIKSAYRSLVKTRHPDVNKAPNAAEDFQLIQTAYEILADKEQRAEYDLTLPAVASKSEGTNNFAKSFFNTVAKTKVKASKDKAKKTKEPEIAPAFVPKANKSEEEPLGVALPISFKDGILGCATEIEFSANTLCRTCEGYGIARGTASKVCTACDGIGKTPTGPLKFFKKVAGDEGATCSKCKGRGQIYADCSPCRGAGATVKTRRLSVDIPPGLETGDYLRIRNEGNVGLKGRPDGDVYVTLTIGEDPDFTRQGMDICTTAEVPLVDALVGGTVKVAALDGSANLKVPPGTTDGSTLVVRGRGVPGGSRTSGNLQVQTQLRLPKSLTEPQKKVARELAALRPNAPVVQQLGLNYQVTLQYPDALLGVEVQTSGSDGPLSIAIPPCTQPASTLLVSVPGGGDGELMDREVAIAVEIPRSLTDKEKRLVGKLGGGWDEAAAAVSDLKEKVSGGMMGWFKK